MKVGLLGLVFLVLLVAKLVGTITWSWWLVTAPLWAGYGLVMLIVLVAAFLAAWSDSK